jgi:preprotein translocase subunit YajC
MFISNAYAQGLGGMEGQMASLLPIILMFVVLYFLMIRPQMKKQKEHKSMVESLQKGDEIVSAGGIVGKVNKVGESYISMEIAQANGQSVEINVQKAAVQVVLPKGTIKAI